MNSSDISSLELEGVKGKHMASHPAESLKPRKKHWIGPAIKHPGALTEAAKEHGVSKLEEAEKESHSSNPSIRARGNLGKRFIKHDI